MCLDTNEKLKLFYYLAYFCYYLWVLLYFLVLFMGPIVLFQLTFTFIYNTFSKKISIVIKQTVSKQTLKHVMKLGLSVSQGRLMYKRKTLKCTQAYLGVGLAEDTLMVKLAKIECTKVMLGLAEGFFFFHFSASHGDWYIYI